MDRGSIKFILGKKCANCCLLSQPFSAKRGLPHRLMTLRFQVYADCGRKRRSNTMKLRDNCQKLEGRTQNL